MKRLVQSTETLIIGAGPSGLALAYGLNHDYLLLEAENSVGGLCRSIHSHGAIFDIGGHSFHTPHRDVYELVQTVLDGKLYEQTRDARVYTHGVLIPYPFQKFYDLIPDPDVVRECEEGLTQTLASGGAANFEEYIVRKFGSGIARHFMLPYNRKLWARDISTISCEWISERVAAPKGTLEAFDTSGGERRPLQHGTSVAYPSQGGYEEIFRAIAARLRNVALRQRVTAIDAEHRTATTSDGNVYHWRRLVSTMPLPILLCCLQDTPHELITLAGELEYMSLRVELLVANSPLLHAPQRIYVADPAVPPHKIAFNHHSSDSLRARPHHGIMAEVSCSPMKTVDQEAIAPLTANFLTRAGILDSPQDIIWSGHIIVKHAYPVYTHRRPQIIAEIKEYLQQRDIYTIGRFGEWEYINADKCMHKGLALSHALNKIAAVSHSPGWLDDRRPAP